jgi:glutamate carboxypeptidase
MRPVCLPTLLLLAVLMPPVAGAAPSDVEQRILRSVDAQQPAALSLLQRAVDINSGTMNFEGVRAVGALFRAELDQLGFTTQWIDGAPWKRAGHLVAERKGEGKSPLRVLLIGHLDTVFEKDSPFQRFEALPGDKARGPGLIDMKGGDVVMLVVLRALLDAEVLDQLEVTVVMTGDEEDSGSPLEKARAYLREAGARADVAIGFEDGDGLFETAVVARRGSEAWTLEVKGKPAHSSLVHRPDTGSGAIYEAARILDAFRRELVPEQPMVTFNPGIAVGGTTVEHDSEQQRGRAFGKTNVIAGRTIVAGDLRTFTPEQRERTRRRMQEIVAQGLPHTTATITFDDGYLPMPASAGNTRLLSLLDQASRELGFGAVTAVDPRQAGAADISFVAGQVSMALDGVGLMGTGGHTVEETADLTTLPRQAKRVAVMLARLAASGRPTPSR